MEVRGGGVVFPWPRDTHCSTQSGICTCSMGMSCSRSSKLCTYWILLMNLTLVGEEAGRHLKASPQGGPSGPEGAMADRVAHAAVFRDAPSTFAQASLPTCASLHPWPLVGEQSRTRGLPLQEEKCPEPRVGHQSLLS